jgi:hypothetical protein
MKKNLWMYGGSEASDERAMKGNEFLSFINKG